MVDKKRDKSGLTKADHRYINKELKKIQKMESQVEDGTWIPPVTLDNKKLSILIKRIEKSKSHWLMIAAISDLLKYLKDQTNNSMILMDHIKEGKNEF